MLNIQPHITDNTNNESNWQTSSNTYKYEYDYTIILNYPGEDGLMDTYLNEANADGDKPRADPSDYFNFGTYSI